MQKFGLYVFERRTNCDYIEIEAETEEEAEVIAHKMWKNGELDIEHTVLDFDPDPEFDCTIV